MSVFSTIGTMIVDISLFDTGMFLAFLALGFGLARCITKSSKHLPVLFTTFTSFFAIMLITDSVMGMYLLFASGLGTMVWFIPMWSSSSKDDLGD